MLLAAGGTGGHFYPGFVLGQALRERGFEPLYLVRAGDPAAAVLDREGFPFVEVPMRGLPRRPSLELARFFWRLAQGLRLVRDVVADFQPDAVVGMGGYLTFPAAFAAGRRGIPVLLHEANAILGLANRASLPFASRLALGLPFPRPPGARYALTGTPVRPSLWRLPEPQAARRALGLDPEAATLLVFGGSQGARALNQLMPQALARAAESGSGPFQVLHLPGAKEVEAVTKAYAEAPFKTAVLPYLHEMERGYAAADLVVSRAGASTLAELAATRRPALLIPFPHAAAGHQDVNADVAARAGAALSISERGLTAESLAAALRELLPSAAAGSRDAARRARLLDMGGRWSRLGTPSAPDCVSSLAQLVGELADRGA
ncbi:MAG: UDP-N-acetylglucosamine--N-acetylmuramyl-(pentapeptide) pyrophosphoryl-undecaprenol N-acetylglucosamine transferase [Elusimicrobia bacterium]|nr:UDP-N-acetylglucosamine--N-acetylmuramyl-(pentapeptide) pyrophosphoryl-undecaprenol N-acetylglucosamine transferase [Elusimicrobiota bacterium]